MPASSSDARPSKLRRIDDFKRNLPYISASALTALIADIKEKGPPEVASRKDIALATKNAVGCDLYGPLLMDSACKLTNGESKQICHVNPLTLIAALVGQGGAFSDLLLETLAKRPCSYESPYSILLYADEVTPGNPLGHTVARKCWIFYMSILELGPVMLQKEQAWLTIMVQRSSEVATFQAGVSQLYKMILRSLFCSKHCKVQHGLSVKSQEGQIHHLFLKFAGILQDGGAHKFTWTCKGDAGTKFCMLCQNLVAKRSDLVQQDGESIITANMRKYADLVFATNDGIYESIDTLISKKSSLTAARFKLWEQACGFNLEPEGLLFDKSLRGIVLPAEHFIHDWMHAILCNGVFATVLTLWIQAVEATGRLDVYKQLGAYMTYWTLPKGKQAQLVNLFSAKKKKSNKEANSFKATASEFLGLYPILAYFLQVVIIPAKLCEKESLVLLEVSNLLDILQIIPVRHVMPTQLLAAVEKLFNALKDAGWEASFHAKFHWLLHFSQHLQRLQCLPSCFTHERKHKAVKKYMQAILNTVCYEKSVLQEVVAQDLFEAKCEGVFSTKACLEHKNRASKKWLAYVEKYFAFESCFICSTLCLHPAGKACKQDIVLYQSEGAALSAGEVWLHTEIDEKVWTLMSPLALESYSSATCSALWSKTTSTMLLRSNEILCPVTWKQHEGNQIATIIPMQFRP